MRTLGVALVALLSILNINARTSNEDLMFRHLDIKSGLSNNQINDIMQDSRGLIWIGTARGLNRFDGYNFKTFLSIPDDSTTIHSNYIQEMYEDKDGRIWIKGNEEFSVLDPYTGIANRNVKDIMQEIGINGNVNHLVFDRDHNLWATSDDGFLYLHTPGSGSSKMFPIEIQKYGANTITALNANPDHVVLLDDLGHIYDIDRHQLILKEKNDGIRKALGNDSTLVNYKIYFSEDDIAWISSIKGLWKYDLKNHSVTKFDIDKFAPGDFAKDVSTGPYGRIWIALDHSGLLIIENDGSVYNLREDPNNPQSLSNDNTTLLMKDAGGTIWVGTYKRGVSYFNDAMFKFWNHKWYDMTCFLPTKNLLWGGTDGHGLVSWDPVTNENRSYPDAIDMADGRAAPIVCLMEDSHGKIWVGTFSDGLKTFVPGRGWERFGASQGLSSDNIWGLAEDHNGKIWIATLGGGIQSYDPATRKFTTYNMANSTLTSDWTSTIVYCKETKKIYCGMSTGIAEIGPETGNLTMLDASNGYNWSNDNIVQLVVDTRGMIWVATRGGLDMFNPKTGKVTPVSLGEEFQSPFVLGIAEDQKGDMWAAVGPYIFKIIPTRESGDTYSFTVRSYNDIDGLPGDDFNQKAIACLSDGMMVVGSLDGMTMFNPANIKYNNAPPMAILTDLFIDHNFDHTLKRGESLTIAPDVKEFSIWFGTNDYVSPSTTNYYYKLEGFNDDWILIPTGQHRLSYSTLPAGDYTLRVRAVNNDGLMSDEEAVLQIKVEAPWYATWWAITIYVLLGLIILFIIVMLIRRKELARAIDLQKEEEEKRFEEIEKLKGTFFTNISHELRTPLTLILSPIEKLMRETTDVRMMSKFDMIHSNARRLLRMVNELLDFRKLEEGNVTLRPAPGELITFAKGICETFTSMNAKKRIDFQFIAPEDEELHATFDHEKLGTIITNLLSNAYKYTPDGGRATFAISASNEKVYLRVTDTGIGIKPEDRERIFERYQRIDRPETKNIMGAGIGLTVVKKYVEMMDGTVKVNDNHDSVGSSFEVEIPMKGLKQIRLGQNDHPAASVSPKPAPAPVEPTANFYPRGAVAVNPREYTERDNSEDNRPFTPSATLGNVSISHTAEGEKPLALVVDDNSDLITFMREGLSPNFDIITAENGEDALDKIFEDGRVPDVVLTDVMMPYMDGIELCRRLKGDPLTANIPVIMLTAKDEAQAKVEGYAAGADDYLTKPFKLDEVIYRMQRLINKDTASSALSNERITNFVDPEPRRLEITSVDEQLIEKATAYIEENIQRSDLTVEELSNYLGISRVHLYKKMKQITDRTPTELIRTIRLKISRQMLEESGLTVQEIAWRLGFSTPRSFSKYFMEEYGILPSAYQKSHKEK